MITAGLYIHIPFCVKKCAYCNFYSVAYSPEFAQQYISELIKEISSYAKEKKIAVDTIYLGGGTPAILSLDLLERLIKTVYRTFDCQVKEFTIEVNPCSAQDIKHYKSLGINRISMGVQSLDDKILKMLGRRHDKSQALTALENANKYFDNVSADFIIGVSGKRDLEKELNSICDFVKHVSGYILKLEKGTELYQKYLNKSFILPDDDQTADQYHLMYECLRSKGFERYEISNFAKEGYQSEHNLKYWRMKEYIGAGVSAHSYFGGKRYYNEDSLAKYLQGRHKGNNAQINEPLDALFETIMLGLRVAEGINIDKINRLFRIDFEKKYEKVLRRIKPYMDINSEGNIRIKDEYMLLQNSIVLEFMN